ncbi:MAG: c-type cytochrome [Weeksellaceae bacterium]
MKNKFPFFVVLLLSFAVLTGFNNSISKEDQGYEVTVNPKFKNLKILPKDISEEELKGVMNSFNDALGVKCSFCHVVVSEGVLDFASDAVNYKEVARQMMKMTMKINKKHFKKTNPKDFSVNCFTCHQGRKIPSTGSKS